MRQKSIRKDAIETAVVEDVLKMLTPERIDELAEKVVQVQDEEIANNAVIPALENEIKQNERAIANLMKFIERGGGIEEAFNRIDELKKQQDDLKHRLATEQMQYFKLEKIHIVYFLSQFVKGDINDESLRQRIIDSLVNSVTIWDEPDGFKITILLNTSTERSRTLFCSNEGNCSPPETRVTRQGSSCFLHIMWDSKDERYRATVQWTVVTASDQGDPVAATESLTLRQKSSSHTAGVGTAFLLIWDSKDERYSATVRWTDVTASDQGDPVAATESRG